MAHSFWSRRRFLGVTAGLGTAAFLKNADGDERPGLADGRPAVMNPRATSGDKSSEPNWDQRLTVTVGTKEGDLVGSSHKVIQAAVDYVSRLGGGTVRLQPDTFTLRG